MPENVRVGRYRFDVPATIPQAIRRKRSLEAEVGAINFQLSDKKRRGKNGEVLPADKYDEWARGAKASRLHKESEIRFLKDWIAESRINVERRRLGVHESTDRALLARMHGVVQELLEDSDFSALAPREVHEVCELTRRHLRSV